MNKEIILDCENQLLAAMKSSHVQKLDELLHDDLLFVVPDGSVITKAMDLEAHRSGKMVIEKLVRQIEEIRLFGDTALVTLTLDTKGKMLDQPIEGKFRYLRVWKLFDGQWKVMGGSCTAI